MRKIKNSPGNGSKRVSLNRYMKRVPYFSIGVLFLVLLFITQASALFFKKQVTGHAAYLLDTFLENNLDFFLTEDYTRLENEARQLLEQSAVIRLEVYNAVGNLIVDSQKNDHQGNDLQGKNLLELSPVVARRRIEEHGMHRGDFRLTMSTGKASAVLHTFVLVLLGIFCLFSLSFLLFFRHYNSGMKKELLMLRDSIDKKVEVEALQTREFSIEELALFQRKIKSDSKDMRILKEELEQKENLALVGNFASSIVHDIRNPLSVISGYAEMLKDKGREKERKYAVKILESTLMIARLLEDILKFVRDQKLELKLEPHRPEMVLQAAVEFLETVVREKSIRIAREMAAGHIVYCDIDRLSRAVMNLVKNSIEVSQTGDTITLKSYREEDTIVLTVKDTGPGIPESIRDTVFEPFSTANKKKGTGLGLFIVKNIVEAHNGTISFETGPTGSEFFIKIPVKS